MNHPNVVRRKTYRVLQLDIDDVDDGAPYCCEVLFFRDYVATRNDTWYVKILRSIFTH